MPTGAAWGHFWTLAPVVRDRLWPRKLAGSRPWMGSVEDPHLGTLPLYGQLDGPADARTAILILHGLGGSDDSPYCRRAAGLAAQRGLLAFRLSVRGARRDGTDLCHAGLTDDIHAALASPALAHAETILLLGYSLGGHMLLRLATEAQSDPRIAALATVCSPLDLAKGSAWLDGEGPGTGIYRRNVLQALTAIYRAVDTSLTARPHPGHRPKAPWQDIARATTLRVSDSLTVVPRFGFDSVDSYYARVSVAPRLHTLRVPTLICWAPDDPMVHPSAATAGLEAAPAHVTVVELPGIGHVGYPPWARLPAHVFAHTPQARPERTTRLEDDLIAWLLTHGAPT